MKGILTIVVLIIVVGLSQSYGQEIKKNTIYLEAGGASFFYSINYDHIFKLNESNYLAARAGLMYVPYDGRQMTGIPLGFSYLRKFSPKNLLEIGFTAAGINDRYPQADPNVNYALPYHEVEKVVISSVRVGIRHPAIKNHLFWNARFQFSLIGIGQDWFNSYTKSTMPLISLGLGYSF